MWKGGARSTLCLSLGSRSCQTKYDVPNAERMQRWFVAPLHYELGHARICEVDLYSSESRIPKLR